MSSKSHRSVGGCCKSLILPMAASSDPMQAFCTPLLQENFSVSCRCNSAGTGIHTSNLRETVNSFDYSLNNHHWISPTNYNINGRISSVSKSTLKRTFESPTGGFDNGLRFLSFCTLSFYRCVCAFMRRPMQRIATAAPSRDCTHDANASGVVNRESYGPVCYSESFEIVLHESNRTLCRQICRSDISSQQPQNNGLSDHREQIPLQELTNKPKLLYNTATLSSENSWRLCKHWKVFVNVIFILY